jgi:hypothetical protein
MFCHKSFDALWQQVRLLIGLRTHFLAWLYAGFQLEYAWVLWLIWIGFGFGVHKFIWDLAFRDLWVLSTLNCCCLELEATAVVQRWQNGLQKLWGYLALCWGENPRAKNCSEEPLVLVKKMMMMIGVVMKPQRSALSMRGDFCLCQKPALIS